MISYVTSIAVGVDRAVDLLEGRIKHILKRFYLEASVYMCRALAVG